MIKNINAIEFFIDYLISLGRKLNNKEIFIEDIRDYSIRINYN
jgi:hypothetical protein